MDASPSGHIVNQTARRLIAGLSLMGATLGFVAMAANGAPPAAACDTPTTRFCDYTPAFGLPPGWNGRLFRLSQNYPAKAPADSQPWLLVDPKADPAGYAKLVLGYFFEGNLRPDVASSFDPRLNRVRGWYNAPWQDTGQNGREPIHGLTRERVSAKGELGPLQTKPWNNYAVGFYNAPGGVMISKVWANHDKPDPSKAIAPEGTVAAKLLFSTASDAQVPWLKGSPAWDGYVLADVNNANPGPNDKRAVRKVRLLQIDFAVKDSRAGPTGWFFGTFVYGGGPTGKPGSGWGNVAPVGLMWGNDPGYGGAGPLKESWINPAVSMPHLGYQGRLNGPVDNPKSSCLSCHATAESPKPILDLINGLLPPTGADAATIARWFRNLPPGTPFTPGKIALDNSMQIAFGISGFEAQRAASKIADPASRRKAQAQILEIQKQPARGGAE